MPIEKKSKKVAADVESVESEVTEKKAKSKASGDNASPKQASLAECNAISRASIAGIKAQQRLDKTVKK